VRAARRSAAAVAERLERLDDAVRELDRLAGLGGLVAEIVHEVRNPLVSIKTFLDLLPERLDDPDFRGEFLEVARDEMRRIERLLDLVLDHARPRRAEAEAPQEARRGAAPDEAIRAVARLLAHRAAARGVRLEAHAAAGLPAAAIAPDALRQVLLNLAVNAIEATPADGDVRLSARALGRALELRVEDRGPGVPAELRRRIFEPFFSTRRERPGGLGLAISRRIVEEAGGTLVAGARPGGGSCFRVRLPLR
jgi:signal transduction histidine kinase